MFCIYHPINDSYLKDMNALLRGQNDAFTSWNDSVESIMTFKTHLEAQFMLNIYELYGCIVTETPAQLLADTLQSAENQ